MIAHIATLEQIMGILEELSDSGKGIVMGLCGFRMTVSANELEKITL